MGQIYIINDLSQSQPWLYSLIAANAGILSESGIVLAPFNPWTVENVPHHCHLWMPQPANVPCPDWLEAQWRQMGSILEKGGDLLIIAHTPWLEAHQYFFGTLATRFPGHSPEVLMIKGHPLIALEQRYREMPLPEESGNFYLHSYLYCDRLTENAAKFFGSANVHELINSSPDVASGPQPDLAAQVSGFLNCGSLSGDDILPADPLFFRSHDARILARAHTVRYNACPRMDEHAYIEALKKLDLSQEEVAVSPWPFRKNIIDSLEATGSAKGFPPAPEFLLLEKTQPADGILSTDFTKVFAASLPKDMGAVLLDRFARDRHMLSDSQKIFNSALCETVADYRHIGEPEPPVALAVLTMTYNHEDYISTCLESVASQRTTFPFRHIVLDHCSTDGTAAIIEDFARTHPNVRPVLLEHRAPSENVIGLFSRCRTKYAALCDGDDYFTDPLKLQKQVDYLEGHPQCALCFHPVAVTFEDGSPPFRFPPLSSVPRRRNFEFYLADLTAGNFIQTNSVLYRWRFAEGLPSWFRADVCPGDWYWHMLHAEKGKIGFLPETMSVYRRHKNALYLHAFKNAFEHWRKNGLAELEAYKVYNDHFNNRYFRHFAALANGIFAAFLTIAVNTDDASLLNAATDKFPQFAANFYRNVKKANKKDQRKDQALGCV